MRTIIIFFFLLTLVFSYQIKQNGESTADVDVADTDVTDTIKSSAIFWIDKVELKNCKNYGFRTVKAKVLVQEDGKVKLIAFVKQQSLEVEKYIRHHLNKFLVSEKMLTNNYILPGEQYVQLRCNWDMLKGK